MIDLFELGVGYLEHEATENDDSIALQILSQPELMEAMYDGLRVETNNYGVCNYGPCGNVSTTYRVEDSQSGWWNDNYCRLHAQQAMMNGIERRVQDIVTNSTDYSTVPGVVVDIIQGGYSMRSLLVNTNHWPEVEPAMRCGVCQEGICEDHDYRGLKPNLALDADGGVHTVHMNCSWTCYRCEVRYTSRARFRRDDSIRNHMNSMHIYYTPELGGTAHVFCQSCVDQITNDSNYNTDVCNNCANLIIGTFDEEEITIWSDVHDDDVCQSCYDDGVECGDCGYSMYNGSYHECHWDDEDDSDDGIHSYMYKPTPMFHGEYGPYMGFELEVESSRGDRYDGVQLMDSLDPREQRWYLKHDGSLSYGFEIVTHPHNLDEYHKLDWSFLDKLNNKGFRSWNTSSCGLHVHIGLDAFADENHQIRFTKFIYDNERQVKRIAGRSSAYAAFDDKGKVIPKIKRKYQDSNRYSAVNVQNEKTLEVRVFRGSLRKERVLSAIEFTHAACEYTRNMKIVPKQKPFSWLRFSAFVAANDDKYPNLFIIMNETFERAREIDQQEDGDND